MDKERIEKESALLLAENGFELVDLKILRQGPKPLLQFFIDRENGGVTLDDCGRISEKLGAYLDVNNIIAGGYILEISSPGIDRLLRNAKDFLRFKGSKAKIRLKRPVNGARVYYGEIVGFENGEALLSDNLKFSLNEIEEARLHPGDDEILKKRGGS
ncbi:MAG: ribosome maturation factor RimP [Elusimicrobia bacterium]|nr:ribosome maturation factor RimP [Elusimicrobiota bacterium]